MTTLYPYSPVVSPRPRDWPKNAMVTGYWQLKDRTDWQPSAAFQKFLSKATRRSISASARCRSGRSATPRF